MTNTKHTDAENRSNLGQIEKKLDQSFVETNHTDSVEAVVLEASNRLARFEHEPAKWHNMMVYEASDLEGFLDWLHNTITTLQATQSHQVEEAVERVAKAIYDEMVCDDPRGKPDWVPGGNSIKQDEARRKALQALTLNHQD